MEETVVGFLEGKTILVTGVTGFLGKLFVEKVLRVQPNVKRLYLLLRAPNVASAAYRLQTEVLGKDVFRVLKERHGEEFDSFISNKVIPIAGDVGNENLGIEASHLREALQGEIHVIIHSAATTRFDERYDVALRTNTLGAKHVVEFSKKCLKLEMLIHVSTAYVAGEKAGIIFEKPFNMGETLNGLSVLNIEEEWTLIEKRLEELHVAAASTNEKIAMRTLGMQRAKAFGWPNTYVFTKAMGEMLVGHFKENLPVAIVRPAMVSSTRAEPFPGWIEGSRTFDSVILAYARGHLRSFIGNRRTILDVVPVDLVVNAMIVIMFHQLNQRYEFIYHVGSSSRNPMNFAMLEDCAYHYFLANPQIRTDGSQIQAHRATIYHSKTQFDLRLKLPFNLLRMVLCLANIVTCNSFKREYVDLNRKYKLFVRMVDLYEPFVFFKGIFDVQNLERVREAMVEGCNINDGKMFDFNIAIINWRDYLMNTHIPGLLKYELK